MSFLEATAGRLSRPDMLQGTVLLFIALGFTLAVGWPTGMSLINETWFSLAPVRTSVLAFGALIYGAVLGSRPVPGRVTSSDSDALPTIAFGTVGWHREAAVTLSALVVLAAVTAPFEVVSHAASYPGTDVIWSLFVPFLALGGYFGLGLLLGKAAAFSRLTVLLPLLVPAVMAATFWLDVSLDATAVNPWSAALAFSPLLAAVLSALSLVSLWAVFPRREANSSERQRTGMAR